MEVVIPATCYGCGTPYSGGSVLYCSTCQRRERRASYVDPVGDVETWALRQMALGQRAQRELVSYESQGYNDDY